MRSPELPSALNYVEALYAKEDAGLRAVRERLIKAGRWGVNIGANEGRILQLLMRVKNVKTVVEIGALYGYSAIWMARALPTDGHLFTIERDEVASQMAQTSFDECGVSARVTLLRGDAADHLKVLLERGPFDMVFIDANKSAYVEYLEWAYRALRPGGLVVADNTLLGGGVLNEEKPANLSVKQWTEMRRFNALVADESRFFATMLPTAEGLTVAIRL